MQAFQYTTPIAIPQLCENLDTRRAGVAEMETTYMNEMESILSQDSLRETFTEQSDDEETEDDILQGDEITGHDADSVHWTIIPPDEREWWKLRIRRI